MMSVNSPAPADPQVASETFRKHLGELWATGRPAAKKWARIDLDDLRTIVVIPGQRPEGQQDWYFVKLGAEYYDAAPPTATFVNPADWSDAVENSRWFPVIEERPSWFGLHSAYQFPDQSKRQLICCSMVAQFYMTDHSPTEAQLWKQGQDTVAATMNRIAEMLGPGHYRKPSA